MAEKKKASFSREGSMQTKKFNIEDKVKTILDSAMPQYQKDEYIKSLTSNKKIVKDGVSLGVYARLRNIDSVMSAGMKLYPKAVGVGLATLEQWDEIFMDY